MCTVSRRLLVAAGIGCLLLIWYLLIRPNPYLSLRPEVSPQQARQLTVQVLQQLGAAPDVVADDWQVGQAENSQAERYLQHLQLGDDFAKRFGQDEPLVYWKLHAQHHPQAEVWINQKSGRVEAIRGISLQPARFTHTGDAAQIKEWISSAWETQLDLRSTNQLANGKRLTVYQTAFSYHGLTSVVEVEQRNSEWTGFTHHLVLPATAAPAESPAAQVVGTIAGLFNFYVLLFPLYGLLIFLFRAKRLAGWRWTAALLAGVLTLLGVWLQEATLGGLAEGVVYGAAAVVVVQVVYHGRLQLVATLCEPGWLQRRVWLGYCLFAIQVGTGVLFSAVAEHFGGFMSDVQGKELIAVSAWPLLLPLATGLAAAVFEELVYRKFADVWLRYWIRSTWGIGLVSSLLWSIGHLGYDVAPWYLRIVELGLVAGPLSFWMYRRYGLFATILAHFLYNLFVTCHDLVDYYGSSWSAVYLYLLTPCLLLLLPLWKTWLNRKSRII